MHTWIVLFPISQKIRKQKHEASSYASSVFCNYKLSLSSCHSLPNIPLSRESIGYLFLSLPWKNNCMIQKLPSSFEEHFLSRQNFWSAGPCENCFTLKLLVLWSNSLSTICLSRKFSLVKSTIPGVTPLSRLIWPQRRESSELPYLLELLQVSHFG